MEELEQQFFDIVYAAAYSDPRPLLASFHLPASTIVLSHPSSQR